LEFQSTVIASIDTVDWEFALSTFKLSS